MTSVPSQYQGIVTEAVQGTGLPEGVVVAQINEESGFNPNAVSPTGAEGMFQFEPGTLASTGGGNPFDPSQEVHNYINYMNTLLSQEGGSVYKALEAYNAGPGNLQAGAGYASTILANAGTGSITVTPGSGASSPSNPSKPGKNVPQNATATANLNCPSVTMNPLTWFSLPSSLGCQAAQASVNFVMGDIIDWAERLGLILLGAVFIIVGIIRLSESNKTIKQAMNSGGNRDGSSSPGNGEETTESESIEHNAAVDAAEVA